MSLRQLQLHVQCEGMFLPLVACSHSTNTYARSDFKDVISRTMHLFLSSRLTPCAGQNELGNSVRVGEEAASARFKSTRITIRDTWLYNCNDTQYM